MSDVLFQDLSTVQSNQQLHPATIASAATIAPTTFITFVSGTVGVATITPPVTGQHMLVFIFTNANPGGVLDSGNVENVLDPAQNQIMLLFYNPITAKYRAGVLASS